ncbi:MAG: VOC family protein [Verrucomicrobia bacterium]|nr:VOC family protein [Verrucomicrobiota bacterium]
MQPPQPGTISWTDLTVPNADAVRDFYRAVTGWKHSPVDMGGYNDYCMLPPGAEVPAAGICHARGENANLPPLWLIYITVPDLAASLAACTARGGTVVAPTRAIGGGLMAVIRDPAGAVAGLYQSVPNA